MKLLIVDDEPDARELLITILKERGAEVQAAGSAAEGFEALKQWRPDVFISDIEIVAVIASLARRIGKSRG